MPSWQPATRQSDPDTLNSMPRRVTGGVFFVYRIPKSWTYSIQKEGAFMKVKDIMTRNVISIGKEESAEVAARTLTQYNIGVLPVCSRDGKLCGVLTDRDLVTRCLASGRAPGEMTVSQIMTRQVISAQPEMEAGVAAHLMGRQQVRRLPVTENGLLCGMVSLGDLAAREDSIMDAADALSDITSNISNR